MVEIFLTLPVMGVDFLHQLNCVDTHVCLRFRSNLDRFIFIKHIRVAACIRFPRSDRQIIGRSKMVALPFACTIDKISEVFAAIFVEASQSALLESKTSA